MARIAFLLLAHRAPEKVAAQVRLLVAQGDYVAVHFDANAARADWLRLVEGLAGLPRVHLVQRRVRGGWGTWSLVAGTLRLMRAAMTAFPQATHFYLISGDCMPNRSRAALAAHLDATQTDYIESFDFYRSDWIQTGLKAERLMYRHPFNERRQKRLFYAGLWLQRTLGLRRRTPKGLAMRIGSQWWCLRRRTVAAVLDFCHSRPDVVRFFRTVWIPDEVFFQTLVPHLVPQDQVDRRTLTGLMFSDYGMPVTFHSDQADMLLAQKCFFVRKLADGAQPLRRVLADRYGDPAPAAMVPPGPDMFKTIRWLARRGRDGTRTPPAPWAHQAPQVTVIVCKKWHVSHNVARKAALETGGLALASVFDEVGAGDPDLGGFARTPETRRADPMAYLDRAAEVSGAHHVLVCIDPCQAKVIAGLHARGAQVLRLDCAASPDFVAAHSHRIGLYGQLQDAVAAEMQSELRDLDQMGPDRVAVVRPCDPAALVSRSLARTLDITDGLASELGTELELTGG